MQGLVENAFMGVAYWRHIAILSSYSYAIPYSYMQLHLLTDVVVTFKLNLKLLNFHQMTKEEKLASIVCHNLTTLASRLVQFMG